MLKTLSTWGRLVKFSHSVFALPFAMSMVIVIAQQQYVSWTSIALLVLALVFARTAAMAFNRLVDRDIDAKNPRTAERELPAGVVPVTSVRWLLAISTLLFVCCAGALGPLCLWLSPFVLLVLLGYSYTKRVTWLSHVVLGLALALAPGGVWIALTGFFSWVPVPLMAGVLLWVAGFDIIYSCQDAEFDRQHGLFSLPARIGLAESLQAARAAHFVALWCFVLFGTAAELNALYYGGVAMFALVIASQHVLVSPQDLTRVNAAFFNRNALASVLFLVATWIGTW